MDPRSVGLVLNERDGYLRVEEVTLGSGEAVIGRLSSTAYEGRLREDAHFTFVLQQVGRFDVQICGRDYSMAPGSLLAFRPNERRTRVIPGKTGTRAATTLQIPVARMKELTAAMETTCEAAFPRDGNALHGDGGRNLALNLPHLADALVARPSAPLPPRVAQEVKLVIDEILCEMIGRNVSHTSSRRIFPAFHRVRQAEEIMHACSDEPLSLLDIARTLDVSLRSLQLAFKMIHGGQGPRDVLTRIRLEKARQRLLAANRDDQVTTVALDSGFVHLSCFAQAYARAYGERPNETLARRRA
jgi:AraC-like DNA-binding protein